jgi:hypothetical protein
MRKVKALPELGLSILLGVSGNGVNSSTQEEARFQSVKGTLKKEGDDIFFVDSTGYLYEITDKGRDGVYRYNFFDKKSKLITSNSFYDNEPVLATFQTPAKGYTIHDELAVKIAKI